MESYGRSFHLVFTEILLTELYNFPCRPNQLRTLHAHARIHFQNLSKTMARVVYLPISSELQIALVRCLVARKEKGMKRSKDSL